MGITTTPAKGSEGLSLCESVHASGSSPWHLRRLTKVGQKFGGGIDTESLCGRVKPPMGWDLEVVITDFHIERNVCKQCLGVFVDEQVKKLAEKK